MPTLDTVLRSLLAALAAGRPTVELGDVPCLTVARLLGNSTAASDLQAVLDSLGPADIPTLETAFAALEASDAPDAEPAWLGFKIVTDPEAALQVGPGPEEDHLAKGTASADGQPGVFVCFEDGRIVFSRPASVRDQAQMRDVTRGPHMHTEEYPGLVWLSLPLAERDRLIVFGAGEIAHYLERMASDTGWETVVVDEDASYLNKNRLPLSRLVLVDSLEDVSAVHVTPEDDVVVVTRGHDHDAVALIHAVRAGARYVGMMGSPNKNERVFTAAEAAGLTREQLAGVHAPIGLKFGARTPAELALCIVAELVKVRAVRRGLFTP